MVLRALAPAAAAALCVAVSCLAAPESFPGGNGRIVFIGESSNDRVLKTVNPDGSGLRQISRSGDVVEPQFSPDGSRIAFVRDRYGTVGKVFVVNTDGTGLRRVAAPGDHPAWSPDGSRLAYVAKDERRSGLWITRVEGGRGRGRLVTRTFSQITGVDWSPDGGWILVSGSMADLPYSCCLYKLRPDGSSVKPVLETNGRRGVYWASWSPDGRRIAFEEIEGCVGYICGGPTHLAVANADGSGRDRVAPDVERPGSPAWSPDGKSLLFAAYGTLDPRGGIYVLLLSDGTVRRISTESPAGGLDWQPRCTISGTRRGDRIRGRARADLVCGADGDDLLAGGAGRDRLFGGAGNDRLDARDGRFDVVGCGVGRDVVDADRVDLVGVDCERVRRSSTRRDRR